MIWQKLLDLPEEEDFSVFLSLKLDNFHGFCKSFKIQFTVVVGISLMTSWTPFPRKSSTE